MFPIGVMFDEKETHAHVVHKEYQVKIWWWPIQQKASDPSESRCFGTFIKLSNICFNWMWQEVTCNTCIFYLFFSMVFFLPKVGSRINYWLVIIP